MSYVQKKHQNCNLPIRFEEICIVSISFASPTKKTHSRIRSAAFRYSIMLLKSLSRRIEYKTNGICGQQRFKVRNMTQLRCHSDTILFQCEKYIYEFISSSSCKVKGGSPVSVGLKTDEEKWIRKG